MSISLLFTTIESSKKLGSYALANLAWGCLLELSLDEDKALKWVWETQEEQTEWRLYNSTLNYYDLAVITDGLRSACIPAPILKDEHAKKFMKLATPKWKEEHNRQVDAKKFLVAEQELSQLFQKLMEDYPNAWELAEKYFEEPILLDFDEAAKKLKERWLSIKQWETYKAAELAGSVV